MHQKYDDIFGDRQSLDDIILSWLGNTVKHVYPAFNQGKLNKEHLIQLIKDKAAIALKNGVFGFQWMYDMEEQIREAMRKDDHIILPNTFQSEIPLSASQRRRLQKESREQASKKAYIKKVALEMNISPQEAEELIKQRKVHFENRKRLEALRRQQVAQDKKVYLTFQGIETEYLNLSQAIEWYCNQFGVDKHVARNKIWNSIYRERADSNGVLSQKKPS